MKLVQSKSRFVPYIACAFAAAALLLYAVGALACGGIGALGGVGFAAVFAGAAGVAALLSVALLLHGGEVTVERRSESETLLTAGGKLYFFSLLCGVKRGAGLLQKCFKTETVRLFFLDGDSVRLCFPREAMQAFFGFLPQREPLSEEPQSVCAGKGKYWVFLSDFVNVVLAALLVAATVFPAVYAYVRSFEKFLPLLIGWAALFSGIFVALLLFRCFRFIYYKGWRVLLGGEYLFVQRGKMMGAMYTVPLASIAALEIRRGITEKLTGMCRLKAVTEDGVNGGHEVTLFPFLLGTETAERIIAHVVPEYRAKKGSFGGGIKAFLPYLQYLAIPALIVFILSFYINFYLLLLELDLFLFGLLLYRNKGLRAEGSYFELRCGVFSDRRAVLPQESIRCVIGKKNPVAYAQKLTAAEFLLGKYSPAYFCGYISDAEFENLLGKVGK